MDSGISDMINGVLSNPDSLNKIMTLMPAVAQAINNGGVSNPQEIPDKQFKQQKTSDLSAENLMSNSEVAAAFKHLITALNAASVNDTADIKEEVRDENAVNPEALASLASQFANADGINNINNAANNNSAIEKTLDTLKNFSSATSPESDHRLKLLLALKPFMKDGRKSKIDSAIKYMNAAKIIKMFGKNGFV